MAARADALGRQGAPGDGDEVQRGVAVAGTEITGEEGAKGASA